MISLLWRINDQRRKEKEMYRYREQGFHLFDVVPIEIIPRLTPVDAGALGIDAAVPESEPAGKSRPVGFRPQLGFHLGGLEPSEPPRESDEGRAQPHRRGRRRRGRKRRDLIIQSAGNRGHAALPLRACAEEFR
ncbi:hypothetical protein BHE74_00010974 [Ensete ventricosum]|uniref:Uncharacterized protein n=1 Tax=Ensete ventricosum TaxID=4639 RepID=A0A444EZ10_ENSVE|nr:hypothetical protein B296_00018323 [Ensete ventricosum]RWW15591.1 hypothetical protein GW17_00020561 [Ensete ventricosum]RWW80678.1 hypothetical protein BHE74_00010974 [Ensete ventricosum]